MPFIEIFLPDNIAEQIGILCKKLQKSQSELVIDAIFDYVSFTKQSKNSEKPTDASNLAELARQSKSFADFHKKAQSI